MASVYPKTLSTNSFLPQSDGLYKATIYAATHCLGTNYHLEKALRRIGDEDIWESMIAVYRILENGDFEFLSMIRVFAKFIWRVSK